mmetsp:Transcript_63391/g.153055  ORF Transcript_63391/g.153055 Transcript_63391/m.153055 type:complete len:226 (-) Transcript_63391:69-746(-)
MPAYTRRKWPSEPLVSDVVADNRVEPHQVARLHARCLRHLVRVPLAHAAQVGHVVVSVVDEHLVILFQPRLGEQGAQRAGAKLHSHLCLRLIYLHHLRRRCHMPQPHGIKVDHVLPVGAEAKLGPVLTESKKPPGPDRKVQPFVVRRIVKVADFQSAAVCLGVQSARIGQEAPLPLLPCEGRDRAVERRRAQLVRSGQLARGIEAHWPEVGDPHALLIDGAIVQL